MTCVYVCNGAGGTWRGSALYMGGKEIKLKIRFDNESDCNLGVFMRKRPERKPKTNRETNLFVFQFVFGWNG